MYGYFSVDDIKNGDRLAYSVSHQPQPQRGQVLKFHSAVDLMMKQRQVKGDMVPVSSKSDEGVIVMISL